jgi:hypothetical protein
MQVHDLISIFPEEHIVSIDPTTTLPGIEGFLDAFED